MTHPCSAPSRVSHDHERCHGCNVSFVGMHASIISRLAVHMLANRLNMMAVASSMSSKIDADKDADDEAEAGGGGNDKK